MADSQEVGAHSDGAPLVGSGSTPEPLPIRQQRRALHVVSAPVEDDGASRRSRSPVLELADDVGGAQVVQIGRHEVATAVNEMVVAAQHSALNSERQRDADVAQGSGGRPLPEQQKCDHLAFHDLVDRELGKRINASLSIAIKKEVSDLNKKIGLC